MRGIVVTLCLDHVELRCTILRPILTCCRLRDILVTAAIRLQLLYDGDRLLCHVPDSRYLSQHVQAFLCSSSRLRGHRPMLTLLVDYMDGTCISKVMDKH